MWGSDINDLLPRKNVIFCKWHHITLTVQTNLTRELLPRNHGYWDRNCNSSSCLCVVCTETDHKCCSQEPWAAPVYSHLYHKETRKWRKHLIMSPFKKKETCNFTGGLTQNINWYSNHHETYFCVWLPVHKLSTVQLSAHQYTPSSHLHILT
jgi:hypothetical protein